MDTQPSEASQSSETDPQSSELERNEESTSSLSLSSERLEEGLLANIILPMGSAPSLSITASVRTTGGSLPLRSASLETLQRSSYSLHVTGTLQRSEGSETSAVGDSSQGGATGGANVTLVPLSIASSLQNLGSSVDQDSSQLSLDSSNGSTSQGDISQLDVDFEDGLQFSTRLSRTSSDSNNAATTQSVPPESSRASVLATPLQQPAGTSVIVQLPRGRSPQQTNSEDGGQPQQQQEGSRQSPREGEEEGGSRRTGECVCGCRCMCVYVHNSLHCVFML